MLQDRLESARQEASGHVPAVGLPDGMQVGCLGDLVHPDHVSVQQQGFAGLRDLGVRRRPQGLALGINGAAQAGR